MIGDVILAESIKFGNNIVPVARTHIGSGSRKEPGNIGINLVNTACVRCGSNGWSWRRNHGRRNHHTKEQISIRTLHTGKIGIILDDELEMLFGNSILACIHGLYTELVLFLVLPVHQSALGRIALAHAGSITAQNADDNEDDQDQYGQPAREFFPGCRCSFHFRGTRLCIFYFVFRHACDYTLTHTKQNL